MEPQQGFIGRDRELDLFKDKIRAWKERHVLCVSGAGGVGKTRLLHEYAARYSNQPLYPPLKPLRIALIKQLTSSEWSQVFHDGVARMAEELGVELIERDADNNLSQMERDLAELIAAEPPPDAILISLGHHANFRRLVSQGAARGIKIVSFDNYNELSGIVTRVEQANYAGGDRIFAQIASDLNYRGRILALLSPEGPLEQRDQGTLNLRRQYPELQVEKESFTLSEGPVRAQVAARIRQLLAAGKSYDAIWATWNEMALGVIDACQAAGRSDIPLYMCDLCPEDLQYMQGERPWIRATVAIDIFESGRLALRLAAQAVVDPPTTLKARHPLPMKLITAEELRHVHDQAGISALFRDGREYDLTTQGWSSQLQWRLDANSASGRILIGPMAVIDFDDSTMRIAQELGTRLADQFGSGMGNRFFGDYFLTLQELREYEGRRGLPPQLIEEERRRVGEVLAACLNRVAEQHRLVLLFDTIDALTEDTAGSAEAAEQDERARRLTPPRGEAITFLLDVFCRVENCLLVLAGRNTDALYTMLRQDPRWGSFTIEMISLSRFVEQESRAYLEQRLDERQDFLEPELIEPLIALSDGRPILLDLALEARKLGESLEWLLDVGAALPENTYEREGRLAQFERQLVRHLADGASNEQWLLLIMSWVYPLNDELAALLLNVPLEQARTHLERLQAMVFVKSFLVGDQPAYQLHDEMRRMIEAHVWGEIDPRRERQRRDAQIAFNYFQQVIGELREGYRTAASQGQDSLEEFRRQETQAKLIEMLSLQVTRYGLVVDDHVPLAFVNQVAELALGEAREPIFTSRLARALAHTVLDSAPRFERLKTLALGDETGYRFLLNTARLFWRAEADEVQQAQMILYHLHAHIGDRQERAREILSVLARTEERLGNLNAALEYQQRFVKIAARQHRFAAKTYLGYLHRRRGELSTARKIYLQLMSSLGQQATESRRVSTDDQAQVLTNLGFVTGLIGDQRGGEQYCQSAVDLRRAAGNRPERRAQAEVALAGILRDKGDYGRAERLILSALQTFDERNPEHARWSCMARLTLGYTYRFDSIARGEAESELMQRARAELVAALSLAEEYLLEAERLETLHQLSLVQWQLDERDTARSLNEQAYSLSRTLPDVHYNIDCLVTRAEFDFAEGAYATITDYAAQLSGELGSLTHEFPLLFGRMERLQGDVALMHEGDPERAVIHYGRGLRLIAAHGGYGPYTLSAELERLGERLAGLPGSTARSWLAKLGEQWRKGGSPRQLSAERVAILNQWLSLKRQTMLSLSHEDVL